MPCVVERSASQAITSGPSRRGIPLPQFVPPQLSQPVANPPSGAQWVHEIKLDGFRMAARIDNGRVQLLTRTGLDWTAKCPSAIAALANVKAQTAYLDGELCGVDDAGLPSFANTQAATDGERGVRLVYYAFDLLHLDGRDTAASHLSSARRCSSRSWPIFTACSSIVMKLATGSFSAAMPASSALRALYRRRPTRLTRQAIAACGAKRNA
jgi:ATP-dependent DNA ligase